MPIPATDFPDWSNEPNYITGPDVGTPTTVLPSAGEIDEGFVAETAAVPQHVNYLFRRVKEHLDYLRGLATEAITWTAAHVFSNTVTHNGTMTNTATTNLEGANITGAATELAYGTARARAENVGLSLLHGAAPWALEVSTVSGFEVMSWVHPGSGANDKLIGQTKLPRDAVVTDVWAGINVLAGGVAIDLAARRMRADVATGGITSLTTIGAIDTSSGTGLQVLQVGASSVAFANNDVLQVEMITDGLGGTADIQVLWLRVFYTVDKAGQ